MQLEASIIMVTMEKFFSIIFMKNMLSGLEADSNLYSLLRRINYIIENGGVNEQAKDDPF